MKISAFAKINLGLEVLGKRSDGYHDILTLFQSVDLADTLELVPASGRDIRLSGNDPSIPWDGRNLVCRAAELLRSETGKGAGVRIKVVKSIPAGRGLGGGSSNAAMTLLGLNILWDLNLGKTDLAGLGKRLGADVPYFLEGGICLGEERGDRLTPLPDLQDIFFLIVFPPFPIETAGIYAAWRPSLTSDAKPSKIRRFLENKDFGLLENQLEETIFRSHPQLEEHKRFLQGQGAEAALVSGTGSAVFGLFAEKEKALSGWRELRKTTPALVVKSLTRETYWRRLRAGVSPSW